LMQKENGLHNQYAVPVSQQMGLLLGTSSVRPLETFQAYTNSRYAPLTESISNTQVLTSLLLLIRVRKISCAPRATFCRSVIPLQTPKNLRAVEIHTIGSSFIYSCRRLRENFKYILQLKVCAGQGCLSHRTRGMLLAAQYQTLENDALWLQFGCKVPDTVSEVRISDRDE
jgi:hypothetical protein